MDRDWTTSWYDTETRQNALQLQDKFLSYYMKHEIKTRIVNEDPVNINLKVLKA